MSKPTFFEICKGIALVVFSFASILLGSAALIATINPAKADNPTTVNSTGKIMMDQINVQKDGKYFYQIIVWDTESGKSKLYFLSWSENVWKVSSNQLPSSPIY